MSYALLVLWISLSAPASPKRHVVAMQDFKFVPAIVHVAVGDTVVWENRDLVPHTADADNRKWSSGNIAGASKGVMVVTRKGKHAFSCLYHSSMRGTLVAK